MHELAPGNDWSEAIDRAIEACDVFILVASRAALESPYVQRERDLAVQVGRPQVAVWAGRVRGLGPLPTYNLRSSFKRGASRLASDLAAGTPTDWRPHVRLPCPAGVAVYALAPALSVVFAVVLLALFLHRVIGHESPAAGHARDARARPRSRDRIRRGGAAFERRTRVATGAVHALERYQAHSSWGAAMKKQLIAVLVRTVRADQAYLAREIDGKTWVSECLQLNAVADDVAKPIC